MLLTPPHTYIDTGLNYQYNLCKPPGQTLLKSAEGTEGVGSERKACPLVFPHLRHCFSLLQEHLPHSNPLHPRNPQCARTPCLVSPQPLKSQGRGRRSWVHLLTTCAKQRHCKDCIFFYSAERGVLVRTTGDGSRGAVQPLEPLGRRGAALQDSLCDHTPSTTEDVRPTFVQHSISILFPFQVFPRSHLSSSPAQL